MHLSSTKVVATGGAGILLLAWLLGGYFNSYRDDEIQTHLFLKKYPSFQVKFYDMFATEADDKPLEMLTAEERKEYFEYCHFRFGVISESDHELRKCKGRAAPYLSR